MREKLITPEQVSVMYNWSNLVLLLSDNGLKALREHRIIPEQADNMSRDNLKDFLSNASRCSLM